MLGIIPAAGSGLRLQPWLGAKELLPLGRESSGRMRAVSEFVMDRMLVAGADRLCVVVSSAKTDVVRFYADSDWAARIFFVVQPRPRGLCDAIFRAAPHAHPEELVLLGLPDTVWHPRDAFCRANTGHIHLITFPVTAPEHFDAVIPAGGGLVARVEVKQPGAADRRIWGAISMPGAQFQALERLWREHGCQEQFLGDLFNRWMGLGHSISYDRQGTSYWDIGTPESYERALSGRVWEDAGPYELAFAGT